MDAPCLLSARNKFLQAHYLLLQVYFCFFLFLPFAHYYRQETRYYCCLFLSNDEVDWNFLFLRWVSSLAAPPRVNYTIFSEEKRLNLSVKEGKRLALQMELEIQHGFIET